MTKIGFHQKQLAEEFQQRLRRISPTSYSKIAFYKSRYTVFTDATEEQIALARDTNAHQ